MLCILCSRSTSLDELVTLEVIEGVEGLRISGEWRGGVVYAEVAEVLVVGVFAWV